MGLRWWSMPLPPNPPLKRMLNPASVRVIMHWDSSPRFACNVGSAPLNSALGGFCESRRNQRTNRRFGAQLAMAANTGGKGAQGRGIRPNTRSTSAAFDINQSMLYQSYLRFPHIEQGHTTGPERLAINQSCQILVVCHRQ